MWSGTNASSFGHLTDQNAKKGLLAETEGFEPSIGLYNPITV